MASGGTRSWLREQARGLRAPPTTGGLGRRDLPAGDERRRRERLLYMCLVSVLCLCILAWAFGQ